MDNQIVFLPSLHLTDSKRDVVTEIFVSPRNGLFSFFRVEATKRNACSLSLLVVFLVLRMKLMELLEI